ncbi:hypothetical protein FP435_04665 [Lactobacillus sp. PV037]|uniref:hypothetical protein n=1 Tax=Lactobacillus sp. PV037 TaxID=2594496 RepID=UPI002240563D|nr:hypothetical protein [Lactobacillus sp. PV037]QNQ83784.1 hypothetical protein FP435_04665 [Lactobacillus sp. PV037]
MTKEQLNERLHSINPKLSVKGNLVKFNDGTESKETVFDLNKWCYNNKSMLAEKEQALLEKLLKEYFIKLFSMTE